MASDSVQEENTHYLQCFRKAMNYGSGTLFWLHALCRHYRPSPPARFHCLPRVSPVLPAVLPPAISCLRFLTHCFYWLHWYTGYILSRPHIYQWLAVDPSAYQPLGTTGYTGYSQGRNHALA